MTIRTWTSEESKASYLHTGETKSPSSRAFLFISMITNATTIMTTTPSGRAQMKPLGIPELPHTQHILLLPDPAFTY